MKRNLQSSTHSLAIVPSAIILLSLWTGCGPKHGEIVDGFKPQYDALREELADIVPLIPDKVTQTTTPPSLDPLPEFDDGVLRSNTTILMYEHLTDPDRNLYKEGSA